MLVAPTLHCGFYRVPKDRNLIVGELDVGRAWFPFYDKVFGFFDAYLRDADNGFRDSTPRVEYYTIGADRWSSGSEWPPAEAEPWPLYLASEGSANSLFGDGRLVAALPSVRKTEASTSDGSPSSAPSDTFLYDPMNPVPALGGGVCCNQGAALGGSYDQRAIEARADVLVYTSEPLKEAVEVTGSVRPILFVSSDAKDTDFTVKLVDVWPGGLAYNVDDTILRTRYRNGYDEPVFLEPGEVAELRPTPMSTSWVFRKGHRIRVEISSSKFPQYMRNLNTGGNNWDETEGVVARNVVHHTEQHPSRILLPVIR